MARTQTVTILFCDLVGSTALMTRLGDDANDRVRRRFFAALREAVAAHHGEEVKSAGDGLMVAFPASAADAVSCAVAMQRAVSRLGAADPLLGLAIRVGLSSGEASNENDDWFGVPVVEAARLEHAARTGQILCADVTRILVGNRGGNTFTAVGELELKGLPEPLAASEVAWEPDPGLPAIPLPSGLVVGGLPFAGRTAELATLRKAWDDVVAGEHRFVVASGEQGIGKTRLAAEFASALHAEGFVILYGRSETDRDVPYQPFAEALRWYVLAGQPAALREQVGAAGGEIARIVPALRMRLPDLPEARPGDPAAERDAIFDAVVHLFAAIGERTPVLLVVDDLEKAGAQTLSLLRHIVSSPRRMRVLVVALAETSAEGSPWASEAAALTALPGCVPLALTGLARAEVASLLERVAGVSELGTRPSELAERIHRETEGSPRFVAELIARLHESGGAPEAVLDAACPYMGLRSFEAADSGLYFGRDEVIGALLGRLGANRLLSVVGASGSGKSSLVRAGLVPRLRDGALPGSRDWEVLVITPGAHPLAELASRLGALAGLSAASVLRDLEADPRTFDLTVRQALANRPASARILLVADQFEELFTLCRDDTERQRFIDALLAAISTPGGRTMAIVSMRADFYGEAARYPGLAEALEVSHALLGPMSQDDLRAAIERPAAATGLRIEPGLTERILHDVGDEPGGLPLLSHALLETWKRRDGRSLTAAGYAASGGVRGAIAQTAETVYGGLSEGDQSIARNLFVRLTELGEGTEDTRRRVAFAEVVPAGPSAEGGEAVRAVINTLAGARLLTTSAESVEVAHEALIREWPRLREWLDDDRDGLRVMRHLTESAHSWETLGRDEGELYRGTRLSAATDWHARAHPELNPLEREFLDASTALHERELAEAHARARRLRVLAVAASVAAVVALVVGGLAALQWRNANDQKDKANAATGEALAQRAEAETQRGVADVARGKAEAAVTEATLARLETEIPLLVKSSDRALGFVLAAQSAKLAPGARSGRLLNLVLGQDPRYLGRIWPSEPSLTYYDASADGQYVATRTSTGLVELRDATTRRVVTSTRIGAVVGGSAVAAWTSFTPDSKLLVVFVRDAARNSAIVFDVPSLTELRRFSWEGATLLGDEAISPDSARFVALSGPPAASGEWILRVFSLRDGGQEAVPLPGKNFVNNQFANFDRTGEFVAAGGWTVASGPNDRVVGIFDARSLELLRTFTSTGVIQHLGFTGDGRGLVLQVFGGAGRELQVWDPRSATLIERGPTGGSAFTGFSRAGDEVVAPLTAKFATVFTLPGFRPVAPPLPLFSEDFLRTTFGAGDRTLYTIPLAGALEQWDLTGEGLASTYTHATGSGRAAVSPDGKWFVKQAPDGTWARWSLPNLRLLNRSGASPGPVAFAFTVVQPPIAISGDGRYIATVHTECPRGAQQGCPASVVVWDAQSGNRVGGSIPVPNPTGLPPGVHIVFHPHRPLLAIGIAGPAVQTWKITGGTPVMESEFKVPFTGTFPWAFHAYFVPRGAGNEPWLVVMAYDYGLSFWDLSVSPPALKVRSNLMPLSVGVTPDGAVVLGIEGDLRFYRPEELAAAEPKPFRVLPGAASREIVPFGYYSFSTDGKRMAINRGSALYTLVEREGRVTVWDLEKGELLGSEFAIPGTATGAFMAPDGSYVVAFSDARTTVWPLDTKLWAEKVCFAAGRNLTEAEWTKYFPGRDYAVTCDQWPAKPKT